MRIPTVISVILLALMINFAIRRNNGFFRKNTDEFWDLEHRARRSPAKPMDDIAFIRIPDDLPVHITTSDSQIKEYQETLWNLTEKPIADLSSMSNTDIRLAYGDENLEDLSLADSRYTTLIRTLNSLARRHLELSGADDAETSYAPEESGNILPPDRARETARNLLVFAVESGSDIRGTWEMLSDIYLAENDAASLQNLLEKAGERKTLSRIVRERLSLIEIVQI